jgi:hypothetical protein
MNRSPSGFRSDQATRLKQELAWLRRQSLRQQIDLLKASFPELWADAERFVSLTQAQPWEFGAAFVEGEVAELKDTYQVRESRHRPDSEEVTALTDLFYEACALVEQGQQQDTPASHL